MPWQENNHRYFFSVESINSNAPADSGVYGLYNTMEWVYIGESANIRETLLGRRKAMDSCLRLMAPTGFTFELCSEESRAERAEELISELRPHCNALRLRSVEGI